MTVITTVQTRQTTGIPTGKLIALAALVAAAGTLGGFTVAKALDDGHVAQIRQGLEATPPTGKVFSESMVADLPEPARRHFLHAIQPGTPLASRVYLKQTGSIFVGGNWAPFEAEQVLVQGRGFAWTVTANMSGLPVTGNDYLAEGQGRMRMALLGLFPVVNESGPDLSRSAIGRMVGEYMWLPSAWLPQSGATIEPVDADRFAVTVTVDGETTRQVLTVDAAGRLVEGSFPRYGNLTDDKHYQYIPFGGTEGDERTFGGYTIPTRLSAGWWYGTDRYQETFRFSITDARFE